MENIAVTVLYQEPGIRGLDAYEVWLNNGNDGSYEDYYTSLQQPALDAASAAFETIELVENATLAATEQTALTVAATTDSIAKTALAVSATEEANTATGLANTATGAANTAANLANEKAVLADGKATLAQTAATNADTKAGLAQTAATNANTATGLANTATTNANTATTGANTARDAANTAAATANAARGWTPILAIVTDGLREVQRLIDYEGGTGTKPTANINSYVSATGYTTVLANAKNIKGAQGLAGISKIPEHIAQIYAANSQVTKLGKIWDNPTPVTATDIPGVSPLWVEVLTAYGPSSVEFVDFTANKTLALSDRNKLLRGNSATDLILTVPNNATLSLPVGFKVMVKQQGAGKIIVVSDSTVTFESPTGIVSETQFSQFWLIKEGLNTWSIDGRIKSEMLLSFPAMTIADSGTYNSMFNTSYLTQNALIKSDAVGFLAPGVSKVGKIYAANLKTGGIIPVTFTRAGVASYVDNNGVLQTNAAINVPRISYDPITKAVIGYLLEKARINIFKYSAQFDHGSWQKANTEVVAAPTIVAPDGTNTVFLVKDNNTISNHYLAQAVTPTIETHTQSVFVKKESHRYVQLFFSASHSPQTTYANFDLDLGTVSSIGSTTSSTTIIAYPNGWFRISITAELTAATSGNVGMALIPNGTAARILIYEGTGTGIYLWGAQTEANSAVSSYIPTVASQVTRPADIATILLATDGYVYLKTTSGVRMINAKAGTFNLSDSIKPGEALTNAAIFNRALTEAEIIQLGSTRNDLIVSSAKYNTTTVNTGMFDETLFNAEFTALPALVKTDSETILIPGAYKNGFIYGVDKIGNLVPFTFARSGTATYFDKNGVLQTSVAGMPRIDYDPVTKAVKGYLLENAATNQITNSHILTGLSNMIKIDSDTTLGPDKVTIVSKYANTNVAGNHYSGHSLGAIADNTVITSSMFVKAKEKTTAFIQGKTKSNNYPNALFNLVTKTATVTASPSTSNTTASIMELSDGWFRVSITYNVLTGVSPLNIFFGENISNAGDSVSGLYYWGLQYEIGDKETSYIPTVASQVTRIADSLVSVNDIVPYADVSMFSNLMLPSLSGVWTGIMRGNDSTKGRLFTPQTVSGVPQSRMYDGTVVLNAGNNSFTLGSFQKISTSYGLQGMKIAANGSYLTKSVYDDSMGTDGGTLRVVAQDTNPGFTRVYIKSLALFSRQLTDLEHTTITA